MRRIKSHTLEKLKYLEKYIQAYLKATKKLPVKYYIDAFAGTGKCIVCDLSTCKCKGGDKCIKCGKGVLKDGSTLIALKTNPNFNFYILVELQDKNIKFLNKFIAEEVDKKVLNKIRIEKEDSNIFLQKISELIPNHTGCLIFLDPAGSELYWATIEALSKIQRVDILILYPYDMSLVRLKEYPNKLRNFYGSTKSVDIYNDKKLSKKEKREKLLDLYINNLKRLGFMCTDPKQIKRRMRKGKALYHLIFATHNSVAAKIMSDIFKPKTREIDGQTKMNFK